MKATQLQDANLDEWNIKVINPIKTRYRLFRNRWPGINTIKRSRKKVLFIDVSLSLIRRREYLYQIASKYIKNWTYVFTFSNDVFQAIKFTSHEFVFITTTGTTFQPLGNFILHNYSRKKEYWILTDGRFDQDNWLDYFEGLENIGIIIIPV